MTQYIVKRVLSSIPVLFILSVLIFAGVRVIPGDVCRIVLQSPEVDPVACDRLYQRLGFDKPAVEQYFNWIGNVLTGDFGTSIISQRGVWDQIQSRLSVTIELAVLSIIFAVMVGLPAGVYSALHQDRLSDYALRIFTIGWLSMPSFWVATLLVTFPAKWWGYAPPVTYQSLTEDPLANLEKLLLPALSLSLALAGSLARITRSTMLEIMRQDYVRTARAKGLSERLVLSRHALKNAMLPVITLLGLQLGTLL
ncbi:MAG TPA: ABC transporter permease, partial [Dehalococcoidia bacterium]|nr:ABC transporter permease [Dehalococcoidia bacterium]